MAELLEDVRHVDSAFVSGLIDAFASDEETLPSAALHENLSRMEREILKRGIAIGIDWDGVASCTLEEPNTAALSHAGHSH